MKLYDRIMRNDFLHVPSADPPLPESMVFGLWNDLKTAPVIDVGNVASYIAGLGDRFDAIKLRDLPHIVPPFETSFVEYDLSRINGWGEMEILRRAGFRGFGLLLKTVDLFDRFGSADDRDEAIKRHVLGSLEGASLDVGQSDPSVLTELSTDIRWVVDAFIWVLGPMSRTPFGPVMLLRCHVASDGTMARLGNGQGFNLACPYGDLFADDSVVTRAMAFSVSVPVFFGISLLHCKNVKLVDGPLPSRQERRAMERAHDRAPTRFYTLQIDAMKETLRTEGRVGEIGLPRALHLCRGHFQTYTEDRPMFGKYAGTFWVPAHVRGTAEAGMVGKDYRVKPPTKAA